MRILLIDVQPLTIGSHGRGDHLPPPGLLEISGPLTEDGHEVMLLDAAFSPTTVNDVITEIVARAPGIVIFGHSGATSGHPLTAMVAALINTCLPQAKIIYGGAYPACHWRDILADEPYVTAIVRGGGAETVRQLVTALTDATSLFELTGIAFAKDGMPITMPPATVTRPPLPATSVGACSITNPLPAGKVCAPSSRKPCCR